MHKQINGSLVNKLFKNELIENKRLDESIKYGEDALFFWKNLLDVSSIAVSPDVLYHVKLHDDSASGGGCYKPIRRDCIRVWKVISQDAVQVSVELGRMVRAQLGNMAFFSCMKRDTTDAKMKNIKRSISKPLEIQLWICIMPALFLIVRSVLLVCSCLIYA